MENTTLQYLYRQYRMTCLQFAALSDSLAAKIEDGKENVEHLPNAEFFRDQSAQLRHHLGITDALEKTTSCDCCGNDMKLKDINFINHTELYMDSSGRMPDWTHGQEWYGVCPSCHTQMEDGSWQLD